MMTLASMISMKKILSAEPSNLDSEARAGVRAK